MAIRDRDIGHFVIEGRIDRLRTDGLDIAEFDVVGLDSASFVARVLDERCRALRSAGAHCAGNDVDRDH